MPDKECWSLEAQALAQKTCLESSVMLVVNGAVGLRIPVIISTASLNLEIKREKEEFEYYKMVDSFPLLKSKA